MAVSRNAPCPCGSGKKFKRCCGSGAQGEPVLTADQLFMRAVQLQQQGQSQQAVEACRAALKKAPKHDKGHALLAQLLTYTNDNEGAAAAFAKALELGLKDPSVHFDYGNVLLAIGRVPEAIAQFELTLQIQPDLVEPHINLGNIYLELEQYSKAEAHFRRATQLRPGYWKSHAQLASALTHIIRHDEAMTELDRAITAAPNQLGLYIQQAGLKEQSNLLDEAEALLERAKTLAPEHPSVRLLESQLKMRRKDYEAAWRAVSAIELDEDNDQQRVFVASLAFRRGDVLDKLGRYDEALNNYRQGNHLVKTQRAVRYDAKRTQAGFDAETRYFSADTFQRLQASLPVYPELDLTPIFIVGFFRSGTTLTEQILASHPQITAAGELNYIERIVGMLESRLKAPYPQCLDLIDDANRGIWLEMRQFYMDEVHTLNLPFEGRRWVTDKFPLNMLHLPLIRLLFPEAPLIHTLRHPMDSALSCFFHQFSRRIDWTFDLADTVDYFAQAAHHVGATIERLSLPVHQLRYETLVETPEPLIRALLAHIGADWNENCLAFHRSNRVARTLSYAQVNQPIYTGSRLRYLHYQPYLDTTLLRRMQPTAEAMGYALDA